MLMASLLAVLATGAGATDLPRVASINLCTDQLLMAVADPEQIVGLSPFSRDRLQSWDAEKAKRFNRLSGDAEDVLLLKPDVVLSGDYTRHATRELLKQKNVNVADFGFVRSLDEAKEQLLRVGKIVKQPERAAAIVAQIDDAVSRAKATTANKPHRILVLSRRGWVTGKDSLVNSLLTMLGQHNAASELGFEFGGFVSMEAILHVRPDALLVADGQDFAGDEGQAFLLHPAMERFYPLAKRMVVPEKLTVCGGLMLVETINRFADELKRLDP